MSWLNPQVGGHTHNPHEEVESFVREHGQLGRTVLDAFNSADPLRCYYGDDCNPDEYLGYARRFIARLQAARAAEETLDLVELTTKSFHKGQIGKFADEQAVREVARLIGLSGDLS